MQQVTYQMSDTKEVIQSDVILAQRWFQSLHKAIQQAISDLNVIRETSAKRQALDRCGGIKPNETV